MGYISIEHRFIIDLEIEDDKLVIVTCKKTIKVPFYDVEADNIFGMKTTYKVKNKRFKYFLFDKYFDKALLQKIDDLVN